MARASSSLPVPVSPRMRTVASVAATFATSSRTRCSAGEVFPQRDGLVAHPLLGPLAIVDVSTGDIPTADLSLVIEHGIVPSQKPAIASVALPEPQLQLIRRAI